MLINQTKIFSSREGFSGLEEQINNWLQSMPDIDVVSMDYTDNNSYCSALLVYRNPMMQRVGNKRIFKYATGAEIPAGAIYLSTVTQTKLLVDKRVHATNHEQGEYIDCWLVWHYFLVDVEEE